MYSNVLYTYIAFHSSKVRLRMTDDHMYITKHTYFEKYYPDYWNFYSTPIIYFTVDDKYRAIIMYTTYVPTLLAAD
jgi:hypothetical protein